MYRELPQPMRYVNAHLTGKPLHTYLWHMWLLLCWSIVLYVLSLGPGRYATRSRIYAIIGAVGFILFLIRVVALLLNKQDRNWLFSIYRPEELKAARLDARIIIGLMPILGLTVLCEYWLIQYWQP